MAEDITISVSREFVKRMLILIKADMTVLKKLADDLDPNKLDFYTWANVSRIHDVSACLADNIRNHYCMLASKKAGNDIIYIIDDEGMPGWREKTYFEEQRNNRKHPST